jgi:RNA polymerase sigma factor (sigma-70 family)
VTLYRGADAAGGIPGKALSSYALDKKVAEKFMEGYDSHGNQIPKVLKEVRVPVDAVYMGIQTKDRPLEFLIENDKLPKHLAHNVAHTREELLDAIEKAAGQVHTEPTQAQRDAGNYRKGRVWIQGLHIAIENPAGSVRKGEKWDQKMANHYGDLKLTEGADGDAVDVFLGPDPDSEMVYVIDQDMVGVENANDFFSRCERDERGHCSAGGFVTSKLETDGNKNRVVVHIGDKLLGGISFRVNDGVAKVFDNAAVHPDFRGKKLSHLLYEEAFKHAKELGATVWESAPNRVPETASTYKRLGAKFTPDIPDSLWDQWTKSGMASGERKGVYRIRLNTQATENARTFDEHKVMLGFPSQEAAVEAYHANYPDDWQGFRAVTALTMDEFKEWLEFGDTAAPCADSFVARNSFCPTGPGGGVDPSCSPSSSLPLEGRVFDPTGKTGAEHFDHVVVEVGEGPNVVKTGPDKYDDTSVRGREIRDAGGISVHRLIHPDEPHSPRDYNDLMMYRTNYHDTKKGYLDTSPENPTGISAKALKFWCTSGTKAGEKAGISPQHSVIRAAADRHLGIAPSPQDGITIGKLSDEDAGKLAKNLVDSLEKAPPTQPTLWRGVSRELGAKLQEAAHGDLISFSLGSTSRDANVAKGYGSTIMRILPGAKGIAVREHFHHDQEVITGGTFKVVGKSTTKEGHVVIDLVQHSTHRWNAQTTNAKLIELSGLDFPQRIRLRAPELTDNSFCPTGLGGGVDPTCAPGDRNPAEKVVAARTDPKAMAEVVEANQGLVAKLARDHARGDRELYGELKSEGNLGLMRAIHKFDPEAGAKFSTYAWHWINGTMRNLIAKRAGAEKLAPLGEHDPEHRRAEPLGDREALTAGLKHLEPRLAGVLEARYGLGGAAPKTQEEVGATMGVSKMRVSQLEALAMDKLRARMGVTENELAAIIHNCGGVGGKPGPCPTGEEKTEVRTTDGLSEKLPIDDFGRRRGVVGLGPMTLKAYRVGPTEGRSSKSGLFFAGDRESLVPYARIHPGHDIKEYELKFDNLLLAGHQGDLTHEFFGKGYGEMMDQYQARLGKKGAYLAVQAFDKKLSDEARKRGYDGIVYTSPAPPAKSEIVKLKKDKEGPLNNVANTRWKFADDPDKIKAFQAWLNERLQRNLASRLEEKLMERFAEDGFRKGAGRAFDDVRKAETMRRRPEVFSPEHQQSVSDFYKGTREEFLRSAFGRPVAMEKVRVLAHRSFADLEGVSQQMSKRMVRALTEGLTRGEGAQTLARRLSKELGIGRQRAGVIARTEIVRAHAEGQLDAFANLGVEELGVEVEFATALDSEVCFICRDLEGSIYTIDEARGVIPAHPQCRCAWKPSVGGKKGTRNRASNGATMADWVAAVNANADRIFNEVHDARRIAVVNL